MSATSEKRTVEQRLEAIEKLQAELVEDIATITEVLKVDGTSIKTIQTQIDLITRVVNISGQNKT